MIFPQQITGLILAGGRGRRMGGVDKGLQLLGASTLVEQVLQRLRPQVASVVINANRNLQQYQLLAGAVPVLPDYLDDFAGPLAGLQIGLQFCPTELLLIVPCDAPFLPPDLAQRLHTALDAQQADAALAVTIEAQQGSTPQRQRHPVFALLKRELLPQLDAYLASGERRMDSWFASLRTAEVVFDDACAFRNLNTLADLQRQGAPQLPVVATAAATTAAVTATATATTEAPAATEAEPKLSVSAAQQAIAARLTPLHATERQPLYQALGRVLAEDIISALNVPAYDNSAMDGYALRSTDLPALGQTSVTLSVVGVAYAGHPYQQVPPAGTCIRIMTGAAMPPGCDSVLPQELAAAYSDTTLTIALGAISAGANRRLAGEDIQAGAVALARGTVLGPAQLGLLASLGIAEVPLQRKLRVAVFSTGDELRALGQPLAAGCVYDSNRYTLFGMLTRLGCEVIDLGIVGDDTAALEVALQQGCAKADVIITSGGVADGAADHTRAIMQRLGDVAFWKLALRPGRALVFGSINMASDRAWLFGLPGNPVAAMLSFYLFARPALLRLMGAASGEQLLQARSTQAIRKRPGRAEYQRGILDTGIDGTPQVRLTGAQGSGILRSMAEANCLIVLSQDSADIAAGALVDVLLFDGLV